MKKIFDQDIPETFAEVDQLVAEMKESMRFPKENTEYWVLRHLLFVISSKCLNKIQSMEFMHKHELFLQEHGGSK